MSKILAVLVAVALTLVSVAPVHAGVAPGPISERHCQDHDYYGQGQMRTCVTTYAQRQADNTGLYLKGYSIASSMSCGAVTESQGGAYSPIVITADYGREVDKHTSCNSTRVLSKNLSGPDQGRMHVKLVLHVRVDFFPDHDITFERDMCAGDGPGGQSGTSTC